LLETLIDAGPMIALVAPKDLAHRVCKDCVATLPFPIATTWPALTEAMYFLHRSGGWRYQGFLWAFIERETIAVCNLTDAETTRTRELMERYHDTPMDLADA